MLTGPGAYSATPIRDASPGVSAITGSAAAAAGAHGHISVGSLRGGGGGGSPHLLICQLAPCLHPVLHPGHQQTAADRTRRLLLLLLHPEQAALQKSGLYLAKKIHIW